MAGSKKFSPLLVLLLVNIAAVLVLGARESNKYLYCRDCKKEAKDNYKQLRSECRGNFTVKADRKACELRAKSTHYLDLSDCYDNENDIADCGCKRPSACDKEINYWYYADPDMSCTEFCLDISRYNGCNSRQQGQINSAERMNGLLTNYFPTELGLLAILGWESPPSIVLNNSVSGTPAVYFDEPIGNNNFPPSDNTTIAFYSDSDSSDCNVNPGPNYNRLCCCHPDRRMCPVTEIAI